MLPSRDYHQKGRTANGVDVAENEKQDFEERVLELNVSVGKALAAPHLASTIFYLPQDARVVEWQTRTFEGRMPKGMRVQVPPRAPHFTLS
jgi:hypothetical protein